MARKTQKKTLFPRNRLRSSMLVGTALAVWATPALAQPAVDQLPDFESSENGASASTNMMTNTMTVTLQNQNDVIRWNSFSIGQDATVNFVTADTVAQYVAVNRVLQSGGSQLSEIYGTLSAQSNIDIWLVNQDGVTFGATGSFSGSSLLVSTLPFTGTDAQLLTQLGMAMPNVAFDRNGGGQARRIVVQNGATLNASTGNIVMMAERITVNGEVTAADGSVVLIGARHVTFGDIGSPLSFSIMDGVRLNQPNTGITVRGDVTGHSVVAAAGGRGNNLTATLLNIDSNASLVATEVDGTVLLATVTATDYDLTGNDVTITNGANINANIGIEGPGNGRPTDGSDTRTLVSEQGNIVVISDNEIGFSDTDIEASGDVLITASADISATNTTITASGDVALSTAGLVDFATGSTAIGSDTTRAGTVSVVSGGDVTLGDVTATVIETVAASGTLTADEVALGALDVSTAINIDATNAVNFVSLASDGDISVASANGSIVGGDVNPGNAAPTGAAYFSVGANDNLTLGDVNATALGGPGGTELIADNISLGDVTTTGVIDLVADNGDIEAGILRTDGADIKLTATDRIDLDGAYTALGMGTPVSGNIGIYAGGSIGANTSPQTLSAAFDVAVRSVNGNVTLGNVLAGDDIVLMSRLNGNGTVTFDSVTFFDPGTADSSHATFVVPANDFATLGIADPGAPGTVNSVDFITEASVPGGAFVFTNQPAGAPDCTPATTACVDLTGSRLAIAAPIQNIGDLNNVSGDLVINAVNAVLAENIDLNGNLIITGDNVRLGTTGETRMQAVTGFIDIEATSGNIIFRGDLTLQSNSDGVGAEPINLSATGAIRPSAGSTISLVGGTLADPSAIIVQLGGNFAADMISGLNLDLTDGVNAFTQGNIAIGQVTTNQSLDLRSNGGDITVGQAEVTDALAAINIVAGVGRSITSDTSLLTNGGNILVSAGAGGDINLAQVSTNSGAPTDPDTGNVAIYAGGDILVSGGLYAGEDILLTSTNGDIGTGADAITAQADDDLRIEASNGTVYASSLISLGEGADDSALAFVNAGTADASLDDSLAESLLGGDIQIDAANLLGSNAPGDALTGSGEDSLVIRDLGVSDAMLTADQSDIRIGTLAADTGNLAIEATAGSVSGLADGWTPLAGGSQITANSDVMLNVSGEAQIGSLTAQSVAGSGIERLTIREITVDAANLSAVNRLHIDVGTVANAVLQTTGGTAGTFSQTDAAAITGFENADISSGGGVSVTAGNAAQLGDVSANGVGTAVSIAADTVHIDSATSTNPAGDIIISAFGGNLLVGTIGSAGSITLDKGNTEGELAVSGPIDAAGDLTLTSDANITSADALTSGSGNITLAAIGDTQIFSARADNGTFTATSSANGTTGAAGDFTASLVQAQGDVAIDAAGAIMATDDPASLAIAGFGQSIESTNGNVDLASAGDTEVFSVSAGSLLSIDSEANIRVSSATGDSVLIDAVGDISGLADPGSSNDLIANFGRGDVVAVTAVSAIAGGNIQLGMLDAGSSISASGSGVDIGSADAGTFVDIEASSGRLALGAAVAGTDIFLAKNGPTDGLSAGSLTAAGEITIASATTIDLGTTQAGDLLSLVSPETIEADALQSDGSIAINTGGDAILGAIAAGESLILLVADNIVASSLSASEDIVALAGGAIAIDGFDAGDNVTLSAGTTLDLGGGSTSGGGADDATYILDLALAGDASQTAAAITDGAADANDGDIILEAPDNLDVTGTIAANAADASIVVRNLGGGSNTTSIGTSGGFEISEAELGFLTADTVTIDSGDQDVALGSFSFSNDSLQILSAGDITLSGEISGSGTGTLQIGQGEIGTDNLVDPATLTSSIIATTDTASIDFANGVVDLRAVRIVFGNAAFVTLTDGISLDAAAELLTDAASQLYIGDNSQRVFMQADTLRVAYSDFALFQNTAFSQGGGAILNADAANSVDDVALELFSQGDDMMDSFAIFGEINGFFGRTAGVLPNSVINIGTLSPREFRITQARSRVNGCVIGSPDRGCLIVDLPPPEITTIDERQTQRLISTDDPSAFLNPLVGRGNEGLILDIAQVPLGIDMLEECDADDASCQSAEPEQ